MGSGRSAHFLAVASGAVAALLVLGIVSSLNWTTQGSEAALVADEWVHDFGSVPHGAILTHDFVLRNESDEVLRLELGPPSCGCTVGELKNKLLAPGHSTTLQAVLETTGRAGRVRADVPVHATTDSARRHALAVTVIADVDRHLGLMPAQLELGEVRRGMPPKKRQLKLVIGQADDVERVVWLNDTPYVELDWSEESIRDGLKELRGTLTFDPNKTKVAHLTALGAVGDINVRNESGRQTYRLQVFATVVDEISAEPSTIYWDSTRHDAEQVIEIGASDDRSLEIVRIECAEADSFRWKVIEPSGTRPRFSVAYVPGDRNGMLRSELHITVRQSDGGIEHTVRVPVLAL